MVQLRTLVRVLRDLVALQPQRPQQSAHQGERVGRVRAAAAQPGEELAVREGREHPVGGVHGERGLAHAAAADHHQGLREPGRTGGQRPSGAGEFALPSGEVRQVQWQQPGGRPGGRPGGGDVQRLPGHPVGRTAAQDRLVQLLDALRRVRAQLVGDQPAQLLVVLQRVHAATVQVERAHQPLAQLLGERVGEQRRAQVRQYPGGPAEPQLGVGPLRQRLLAQLAQALPDPVGPVAAQVRQGVAAPGGQRALQQLAALRVLGTGLLGLLDEPPEADQVHHPRVDVQPVPGGRPDQPDRVRLLGGGQQ